MSRRDGLGRQKVDLSLVVGGWGSSNENTIRNPTCFETLCPCFIEETIVWVWKMMRISTFRS